MRAGCGHLDSSPGWSAFLRLPANPLHGAWTWSNRCSTDLCWPVGLLGHSQAGEQELCRFPCAVVGRTGEQEVLNREQQTWTTMGVGKHGPRPSFTHGRGTGNPGVHIERLCKEGRVEKAVDFLELLDQQGSRLSVEIYGHVLKACMKRKATVEAQRVQAHMAKTGFESDTFLGNLMLQTMVKCGSLADALRIFHSLPHRTAFAWTAIISALSKGGHGREALRFYQQMCEEDVPPNIHTFLGLLKACSGLADLEKGKEIHSDLRRHGFGSDLFLSTALVDMYANCGSTQDAWLVFDAMPVRDVVSWNAMIAGYVELDEGEKALQVYAAMRKQGLTPNDRTFVSILKACTSLASREDGQHDMAELLQTGKAIHAEAVRRGYGSDMYVGSSLVSMYAKCGSIADAELVFHAAHNLPNNVAMWNAILAGYADLSQGQKALQVYKRMQQEGVIPNDRTFVSVLKACGSIVGAREEHLNVECVNSERMNSDMMELVRNVHVLVVRRGYSSDPFVANALIHTYAKCGSIADARHIFDELVVRDVVSWNAMLSAYAESEQGEMALELYGAMQGAGVSADARTLGCVLKSFGSLASRTASSEELLEKGRAIHAEAARKGYASQPLVGSSLVCMYARCGSMREARSVFDGLSERDVVSWCAIMAGYARQGEAEVALELYVKMQAEGVKPDEGAFLCILEACSKIGALSLCSEIHSDLLASGHSRSLAVATALTHAYCSCGSMEEARRVFDSMSRPDRCAWTALISGYARLGESDTAMGCFQNMFDTGVAPDGVTFVALLSSCSHAGLVQRGVELFRSMARDHGVAPVMQHYACMTDLLSRAGLFSQAEAFLSEMPELPDFAVWSSLLASCRKHGNLDLARRAFNAAVQLDPKQPSVYMLMSNMYAHAGLWECAQEIQELRRKAGAWKSPGRSWIEYQHEMTFFVASDKRHPRSAQIYELLNHLNSQLAASSYTVV